MFARQRWVREIRAVCAVVLLSVLTPAVGSSQTASSHSTVALTEASAPSQACRDLLLPVLAGRLVADRAVFEGAMDDGRRYRVQRRAVAVGPLSRRNTMDYSCTFGARATTPEVVRIVVHEL